MHKIQKKILAVSKSTDISKLSLREIGKLVNEDHPQKIKHHLLMLEKEKLIKLKHKQNETILKKFTTDFSSRLVKVPVYGEANCGVAKIFAEQRIDSYIKLSKSLLKKSSNIYALKAKGNSLNQQYISGKNIENGDFLIVDPEFKNPVNGDVVVSIIDGCVNIKIFHYDRKEKRIILLSNSNENFDPIFLDQSDIENGYLINGKVIQVIKKFTLPNHNPTHTQQTARR